MDVDHDLIAAGHPRLRFEFASFQLLLHKHWDATPDGPEFEAGAWPLGQLTAARAALILLADRAATQDRQRPWPEFAEYDCAACHHDLRAADPPGSGTLSPSRWYTALLPEAMQALAMTDAAPLRKALAAVETALATNRPERRLVADRARGAVALLDEALAQANGKAVHPAELERLLQRADAGKDLHGAARIQWALARAVSQYARRHLGTTQARSRVRTLLQLPPERDGGSFPGLMPR
jgi:hypothetical protein